MKQKDERQIVAAISYLLLFITGIAILLAEEDDKFIRFHAMQSVYGFGILAVIYILIAVIFSIIPLVGFIGDIFGFGVIIIAFVLWVVSIIKAFNGEIYKWPKIGKIVENKIH